MRIDLMEKRPIQSHPSFMQEEPQRFQESFLDHPRVIPESPKNYSKCLGSLSRVIQRVIHYKFEIIQDFKNSSVNSNLDTDLEVNNRLSDETLELNKCLSVRSRDRVTDCMIEICQASCHTKVQVTKR